MKREFDFDIDLGPVDPTYQPGEEMLATIGEIAGLDEVAFRFWAAMTLYVNISSISPCADAEEVVTFIVDDAIEEGEPTDGSYQVTLDEAGEIAKVACDDDEPFAPDDYERLIFEIVRQPDFDARRDALIELSTLVAVTEENAGREDRLSESRCWASVQNNASR